MKTIDSIAYASSAACFAIVIQVGPESAFWESHRKAALLLGAGISTGVLSAFLRQNRLFEKPGTLGNRVSCALGILVSLAGIGAYMYAFKGVVAAGFFGGAALLAVTMVDFVVRPKITETGIVQKNAQQVDVPKKCWFSATRAVIERLKNDPAYARFEVELAAATKGGSGVNLESIVQEVVRKAFEGEALEPRATVKLLVKAAFDQSVPVWSEIVVAGLALRTKAIVVTLGKSKVLIRQLAVADFEREYLPGLTSQHERFLFPPSSILRLDTEVSEARERDDLEERLLVLLRLAQVGSIDFAERKHGVSSPFSILGGILLEGTTTHGRVQRGNHPVVLDAMAGPALQCFFDRVGPRLERLVGENRDVALSIAYERYCESLLAMPVERKIAACIMGMEALYFRETELQELGYRLSLRVAKAMSKAGVVGAEVQRQVKVAYGIRSKHVHGSYLSANERKRNEKEVGRTLPALAMQLLDYLRMTIVHLLCSTQQKTSLLEMIEASFLSSEKDTELGALLAGEQNVLHSFSHQM